MKGYGFTRSLREGDFQQNFRVKFQAQISRDLKQHSGNDDREEYRRWDIHGLRRKFFLQWSNCGLEQLPAPLVQEESNGSVKTWLGNELASLRIIACQNVLYRAIWVILAADIFAIAGYSQDHDDIWIRSSGCAMRLRKEHTKKVSNLVECYQFSKRKQSREWTGLFYGYVLWVFQEYSCEKKWCQWESRFGKKTNTRDHAWSGICCGSRFPL